jgi:AAA domain-containing protein
MLKRCWASPWPAARCPASRDSQRPNEDQVRISRVRIENFRNFADLVIDPFPTPAVIVGENGVGKTALRIRHTY